MRDSKKPPPARSSAASPAQLRSRNPLMKHVSNKTTSSSRTHQPPAAAVPTCHPPAKPRPRGARGFPKSRKGKPQSRPRPRTNAKRRLPARSLPSPTPPPSPSYSLRRTTHPIARLPESSRLPPPPPQPPPPRPEATRPTRPLEPEVRSKPQPQVRIAPHFF